MGSAILTFLLILNLPCPILGLGIGSILSLGSFIYFCLSGLTCGTKLFSIPLTCGTFTPLDLACDLVCTQYLSPSVVLPKL